MVSSDGASVPSVPFPPLVPSLAAVETERPVVGAGASVAVRCALRGVGFVQVDGRWRAVWGRRELAFRSPADVERIALRVVGLGGLRTVQVPLGGVSRDPRPASVVVPTARVSRPMSTALGEAIRSVHDASARMPRVRRERLRPPD